MIAERVALAEQVGLSSTRLQRIDAVVQSFIERGVISGAVTLVTRKGRVARVAAQGEMDIAAGKAMQTDTIFRLASMTKPVISVAILMLLEEGKLLLSDPVSAFIPTFKGLQVAVPNAAAPGWLATELPTGGFHLVPANREITLRDLLTHTSGLGSATVGQAATAIAAFIQEAKSAGTLADVVPGMAGVPLSFQPGSAWEYSPAFAFDTLGHVVEIVSGLALNQFLAQRIFEPLGMRDTSFSVPADKLGRLTVAYERSANGLQARAPAGLLGLSTEPGNRYYSGGGGLTGTAEDYSRFALMLASGGHLDGERLLGRRTVALMGSNQIGLLPLDRAPGDMRGYRFGLGVRVLDSPPEAASLAGVGTFGWAGAFGTNSWIDPAEQMVGLLLIQRIPDPNDTVLRTLWPRFQNATYQALED
jgi:CubicO group peptidase (beta-lactamase class C family)